MTQTERTVFLMILGSTGYPIVEWQWRGWTHWSMALAGGICFGLLGQISAQMQHRRFAVRCAAGTAAIIGVEFIFGCIFNIGMGMHVWDYSEEAYNIAGQICAKYSFLWLLSSIPLMKLIDSLVSAEDFSGMAQPHSLATK